MAYIGHLVRHDQVVLDVDGGLHIVADDAGAFAAGRHCASIWIGQRDLPIWRGLNGDLHLSQVLHLLRQAASLSFSRIDLASATSPSCRSAVSRATLLAAGPRLPRN